MVVAVLGVVVWSVLTRRDGVGRRWKVEVELAECGVNGGSKG